MATSQAPKTLTLQESFERFHGAAESMAHNPDDPAHPDMFVNYGEAVQAVMADDPNMVRNLRTVSRHRKHDDPTYILKLGRVIGQGVFVERQRSTDIAQVLMDPVGARDFVRSVFCRQDGSYHPDLHSQALRTMVHRRYVNVPMFVRMHPEHFGARPQVSVIDAGAGRAHGINFIADSSLIYHPHVSLKDIQIGQHEEHGGGFHFTPKDDADTVGFNFKYVRSSEFELTRGYALDIVPVTEEKNIDNLQPWEFSLDQLRAFVNCYPTELNDVDRLNAFRLLDKPNPKVTRYQADCTDQEQVEAVLPHGEKVDIAVISTVLYQIKSAQRRVEFLKNLASRARFIMVIDSADPVPFRWNNYGLHFPAKFYDRQNRPFGYRVMVLDTSNIKDGFKTYYSYENGRCERMIPNLGVSAVRFAVENIVGDYREA